MGTSRMDAVLRKVARRSTTEEGSDLWQRERRKRASKLTEREE
jgi:hypothetical protein